MNPLRPVINSGRVLRKNDTLDASKIKGGKVCALFFLNQGTNSLVKIKFNGAQITLDRGDKGQGMTTPPDAYDTTAYQVEFTSTGANPVHNCVVMIQKYVTDENE